MDNPNAALIAPTTINRTVLRRPNAELRTREHLTTDEVERLIDIAASNRQGQRDALMVLLAFRHGLRAAEVCDLRWEQIDFNAATLHVRRIKHGTPATHPLTGREMRALRKHQRASPGAPGAFVFVSERGAPLSAPGFSRMWRGLGVLQSWGSRSTLTCSGMPAAMRLPMRGMILVRYRLTLVIETFRTQRATQRWRKTASRAFGETN
jgi:integrase